MKIVIDDKIPYIRGAISMITADAVYKNGSEICPDDVRDADALIVRTRTRCDERLLGGSRVSFVGTATIGFDHIDTGYMRRAGIEWISCPGCNAASVAQYFRSVLLLLKRERGAVLRRMTLGLVGCGHVGSLVAEVAGSYGMRVIVCDPPRRMAGDGRCSAGMDEVCRESDIITFHVPLTTDGPCPTYHMAGKDFFDSLARRPLIINTSRGGVVDSDALYDALMQGRVSDAVIDTWEHEPDISRRLLGRVWIATPHIAGYSADGKTNADNMVIEGLCRHFGIKVPCRIAPPKLPADFVPAADDDSLRLQLYNPLDDCRRLKSAPEQFEELRGNYPLRRETADIGSR